jgi:hypothetical protein
MKSSKHVILLIVVLAGFSIAVAYYISVNFASRETSLPADSSALSPELQVCSPRNKTYPTPRVQLNFTVDEPVLKVTYTLDGRENITAFGNTTLSGLADGVHSVTVYAYDALGNVGDSETVFFSVAASTPEPTPKLTRDETVYYFESEGFTVQQVTALNRSIVGYDDGKPRIMNSLNLGAKEEVAYSAQILKTSVIYEFGYNYRGNRWKIFFVENRNGDMFYFCLNE